MTVIDPSTSLVNLTDELAQKSDVVVVLLHAPIEEARRLAKEFPWLDVLIVTTENPADAPIIVGESILVMSAPRGESVGILGIDLGHDGQITSKANRRITVSEQIAPSEELSPFLSLYESIVEDHGLDSQSSVPAEQAIHIVYFYKRGCDKCTRVNKILRKLKESHPEIAIEKLNVKLNQSLLEVMGKLYEIPQVKRLTTPAIFIGDEYFLDNPDEARLLAAIQKYLPTGVASRLPQAAAKTAEARSEIISRFHSFGALAVAGAGLLDGINPCAFATIVFFISYLSLVGRKRKEMLMAGIAFASAVFVTYLLLGAGALKFLEYVGSFSLVTRIVYFVAAIATLILAMLSLYDAYKAKKGKANEIKLQLPKSLKLRIHKVIREKTKSSGVIVGALGIGFVVSALELVCTGQVYLPTITFMTSVPGMRVYAFSYLVLYNVMFVVPLLVVFGFVYFGATSMQLGGVLRRHLMTVKIGTGLLLFGLGIWLLLSVV